MSTYITWSGGGARGLRALQTGKYVERITNKPLQKLVDGFAGTSTGGIIALALSMEKPLSCLELESFYLQWLPKIFADPWYEKAETVFGLKRPKYDGVALRQACETVFGRSFTSKGVRCVITTYNMTQGRPETTGSKYPWFRKDLALATSAGPTYFPPFEGGTADCYIDGGVYANNPSREIMRPNDAILHIGTGLNPQTWKWADVAQWGAVQWIEPAISILQDAVSASIEQDCQRLLGSAYLSIDSLCTNPKMDDVSPENLAKLIADGEELVETKKDDINRWVETYCKGRY